MNHNPLEIGDNLPTPNNPSALGSWQTVNRGGAFPTWRETLSSNWNDPTVQVNLARHLQGATIYQPNGLSPVRPIRRRSPTTAMACHGWAFPTRHVSLHPPDSIYSVIRPNPDPSSFSDATGYNTMSLFLQQGLDDRDRRSHLELRLGRRPDDDGRPQL